MSISKMISLHPDVGSKPNETLAQAARHSMFCALMCSSCADACSAEAMDMRQCIRSRMDYADFCEATSRMAVRRTGRNVSALLTMLETCISVGELCAKECELHDNGHCALCAQMCRECAADCRAATPTVH